MNILFAESERLGGPRMKRIVAVLVVIASVLATASLVMAENRPIFSSPMNHKMMTGRG